MDRPHVLFLPSWYMTREQPWHGIFFREQALALQRSGMKVGVIYPELRSLGTLGLEALKDFRFQTILNDEDGLATLRLRGWDLFPRISLHANLWIRCAIRLADEYAARFGRPDVIHAHCALWAGVAGARWHSLRGAPLVITEHSTGFATGLVKPWQRKLVREAFGRSGAVIAVSSSFARLLADQGLVEAGKCRVVPNTVDTSFFTLPPAPRSRPPFRILAVSYFKPLKGIDVLLKAFAEVSRKIPAAELEIGGDGPERRNIETLARDLGLGSRVRFLGTLSREEVRNAMWRAHLFAHASFYETFGVVLIEAMATGLPVVAARCGGPKETVGPDAGLLVPVRDEGALAGAIAEVHDNYGRYEPARIRRHIEEHFSNEAFAEKLKAVYREVI